MNKLFLLGAILITNNMVAQTLINGSFESTSAPASRNYNVTNVTFNSYMPNCTAFGLYEAMDIVVSGCYVPSIPDLLVKSKGIKSSFLVGCHSFAISGYKSPNDYPFLGFLGISQIYESYFEILIR